MKDFDIYYLPKDGNGGRFAGLIIHVCPAGKKVGRMMKAPLVHRVTVTCEPKDIPSFFELNHAVEETTTDGDRVTTMNLRSRYCVDTTKISADAKVPLSQLPIIDRLEAARVLESLGIKLTS